MSKSGSVTFSEIGFIITALKNSNIEGAKQRCEAAKKELDAIRGRINVTDKKKVECLIEFIENVENGREQGVTERVMIAWKIILDYYKESKHQSAYGQSDQDFSSSFHRRQNDTNAAYSQRDTSQGQSPSTYPPAKNSAVVENVNQQAHLEYRSKMAGQAMRYNNPDIADLSDVNRPTKVAERFSELYDNEWTEAFEALTKVKSQKLTDKNVIDILLAIVERAYTFCNIEAEQQIVDMRSAILDIMSFGKSKTTSNRSESTALLVQYRKPIAELAIERLVQKFNQDDLRKVFDAQKMKQPPSGGQVDVYTRKAVELTWWMCVQDPPIHMCLSSDRLSDSECPGLYRAYTRSGKIPDYFVWPALKLHKNGGVLMKGVMQFR